MEDHRVQRMAFSQGDDDDESDKAGHRHSPSLCMEWMVCATACVCIQHSYIPLSVSLCLYHT